MAIIHPELSNIPFGRLTAGNKNAEYICINKGEVTVPNEIRSQSIEIDADIYDVLNDILSI